MGIVERIKEACEANHITLHKLEVECGFANGYLSQLKKDAIPSDRLIKISKYLKLPVTYLITGEGLETDLYNYENAILMNKINENKDLIEALHKFFDLSEKEQQNVIELINLLSD